jgi:very-short-patch-repair endonuclease
VVKKNKKKPKDVFLKSELKYLFDCNKCGHEFSAKPLKINRGYWCPYCSNLIPKICKSSKKCKICFSKSVAGNKLIMKSWSSKNAVSADEVSINSRNSYSFECYGCECVVKIAPYKITKSQIRCKLCNEREIELKKQNIKNKTEKKLSEWLSEKKFKCQLQFNKSWCKNIRNLPFDIAIENLNMIIEIDGFQHFQDVAHWNSNVENVRQRDVYKTYQCIKNGYSIIRVLQSDIWYDRNDWKKRILSLLEKHNKPQIFLLDNEKEYDPLRKELRKYKKNNTIPTPEQQ